MDKSLFNSFRLTVAEQHLHVYGVHVFKQGEGSIEHRFRNDDLVNLYSASKTFTSVGVGICLREGGLKLSDKVLSYFPEYASVASEGSDRIEIRDLLHMSSGKHMFWPDIKEELEMDVAERFFRLPMDSKPGTHFFYSNYCTYMCGRIIEKISGKKLRDYLIDPLFTPLGIYNPQWFVCAGGHTKAASGLLLHTSDLAKLGRLLLQKGEYEGRRILDESYVEQMYSDIVPTAHWSQDAECAGGYGYQVWRCTYPGAFRADGMYGQYAIIFPDKQAVVALTSHEEYHGLDEIRAVVSDILPLL